MILGQYGAVGWYLVILGQYRAICDGTGSVEGGAGQYFYHWVSRRWYLLKLVVLGQYRVVLVGI